MKIVNRQVIYATILGIGIYVFGFNFHTIIHEFGHAIAIWVQNGTMTGFYLHPFDMCYNTSTYVPNHILLYAGGGYLGLPITLLFIILIWSIKSLRTPYAAPFIATCSIGFTQTGFHMLTDFTSKGVQSDYVFMVGLGFPLLIITLTGILYILIGISIRIHFLPLFGVSYEMSIPQRLFIFELGTLPYFLGIAIYRILYQNGNLLALVFIPIYPAILLAIEAILSKWLPNHISFFKKIKFQTVNSKHIIFSWLLGIIIIVIMFMVTIEKM